jgi:hypothetical protein
MNKRHLFLLPLVLNGPEGGTSDEDGADGSVDRMDNADEHEAHMVDVIREEVVDTGFQDVGTVDIMYYRNDADLFDWRIVSR